MADETEVKKAEEKKAEEKKPGRLSKLLSREKKEPVADDEAMTMEEEAEPMVEDRPVPPPKPAPKAPAPKPAPKAAAPAPKPVAASSELRRNPVMNRKHRSIVGQKKPGARKYFKSR